ncbi:MFS general substrate transporter [Pseudovirgaria hyperparasitica]|uniref:MFS general substrate transporter n=1 Tax=Pseudovirgaria hyperparasitica TaxID=470096 RepID=A0A6A6WEB8_9PEZI|nr:MFS general substrate transporter [Pseudovirgaria hyperparasitica]KAF2760340.1 MFS general substrate transporter [Pseudovirgaria hyperparasitica]
MSKEVPVAGANDRSSSSDDAAIRRASLVDTEKGRWERMWPVIACGAGLFSDGYLNGVIGSVSTMLSNIYPTTYKNSPAQRNVGSLAFAGTVMGMLFFGWSSDAISRKWSLFVSTLIIILFAALGAGSYGAGGSTSGLFAALAAFRFLLGIGIGGEYPAGSVGCAESTGELKAGTRNRWFIMFTNVQIDFGFLVAAIVPMIVVLITTESHLRVAWRICLGLGVIPPLSLLYMRIKLQEPEAFQRESMVKAQTPWVLIIKYYWFRLLIVSTIWFIYDFSAYSFGIYSSTIIDNLLGENTALWKSFGWNTLITFFYMPGCIAGAFLADIPWLGPKKTLAIGVFLQAIVGFIMAGAYSKLKDPANIGGFVVVYGLFLAFGEAGPGDNIGLVASKTSATAIRGRYYGIAAAMGKVGAFVGSYVIPIVINNAPNDTRAGQDPFFVGSSLAVLAGVLVWFLPPIDQDTIEQEDVKFREYLSQNGYDTSQMGLKNMQSESSFDGQAVQAEKV